jgi:hypothetical protein
MRHALALAVVLAGCGNKSKLDLDRGGDVDALWALAPDGTELGVVASPRAVRLAFDAIAAVRALMDHPDMAAAGPQVEALAKAMFGSETARPEDAGFSPDRPFAMFATADGVIGVMPVGDRDKFMAAKRGTRGSNEDTLDGNTCRSIAGRYVCATRVAMFDRLGKGSLRGKLQAAGARGDAELLMTGVRLLGDTTGDLAVSAQLDRGQVAVHGRWAGTPSGLLALLAGIDAPSPDTKGASGFVALNVAPLLSTLPDVPIAGGVTTGQLAASLAGPVTAIVPAKAIARSGSAGTRSDPAGSAEVIDIQMFLPLVDPGPAKTIIDNCKDITALFQLAATQSPGACRIVMQGTSALELDIWVDGSTLRLGANKGAIPTGRPDAITRIGAELAHEDWTAVLWGRGTMLDITGMTPAQRDIPPHVALGIHAMALVNELGAAVKIERDGARFRGFLRTAWANPPEVATRYIAVGGADIATGKAMATAAQLAASAPSSPFAGDFAAGQGGLMIPVAAIGLVTGVVLPAIMAYMEVGPGDGPEGAMQRGDLATLLVRAYVTEAYPRWQADNPGKPCPSALEDLARYFGDDPGVPVLTDPWGQRLVMQCDDAGLVVLSLGPDGTRGTADDIRAP